MSDLIRRDDVNNATEKICSLCEEYKKYNGVMCGACHLDDFIRIIDDIPSAEPERKKGEWREINGTSAFLWLRCSECGYGADRKTNFCPNCGADMRGDR